MEFERAVTLLVHIDLEGGVGGMDGEFVVIGEGDDVIAELLVLRQCLIRPLLTFVHRERPFDTGMGMEIGPLPAVSGIQTAVGVEDVRTAERVWVTEVVNGTETGPQDCQNQQKGGGKDNLEQDMMYPAQDMTLV
jgi:hypothetical protein